MYAWPTTPIDVRATREPGELQAESAMKGAAILGAIALVIYTLVSFGIVALVLAGIWVVGEISEWFALAHLRSNGVRVSATQYPELDAMADNFAGRMGIARPEIFVVQQTLWNAFAARFVGNDIVVLYSGAIDALLLGGRPEDLGFLLGHELGHHACGHLQRSHRLYRLAFVVPFLPAWHRRMMELSCDRLALAACGDASIAVRGLLSMTVGTTMARQTNVDAARAQWEDVRRQTGISLLTLYSWYPHHLWRIDSVVRSAEQWALPGLGQLVAVGSSAASAASVAASSTSAIAPPPPRSQLPPPPAVHGGGEWKPSAQSAAQGRNA